MLCEGDTMMCSVCGHTKTKTACRAAGSKCVDCYNKHMRAYRAKNRPKWRALHQSWKSRNPEKARNSGLRRYYGIDIDQYNKMLESQGGVCKICSRRPFGTRKQSMVLHVDHCHATGVVRALLCHQCNIGIGKFQDNPSLLRKAASYLEEHQSSASTATAQTQGASSVTEPAS